jgi:hypothetical protein
MSVPTKRKNDEPSSQPLKQPALFMPKTISMNKSTTINKTGTKKFIVTAKPRSNNLGERPKTISVSAVFVQYQHSLNDYVDVPLTDNTNYRASSRISKVCPKTLKLTMTYSGFNLLDTTVKFYQVALLQNSRITDVEELHVTKMSGKLM